MLATKPRPEAEPSPEQQLATLLHSTFPAPNARAFVFDECTLYVVAKQLFDDSPSIYGHRPGLLWVYDFPASERGTGLWWEHEYARDEQRACWELSMIE